MIAAGTLLASRWAKAAGVALAGVCALAAATSHGASNGGVLKVRLGGDSQQTRVVVELDRSAKAKLVEQDPGSKSLVLSWPDVDVNADLKGTGKGLVSAWAVDESAGAARLKLELSREAEVVRRFLLPPADGVEVYRYVVDLRAKPGAAPAAVAEAAPAKPAKPIKNAKAEPKDVPVQQLATMISAPKEAPAAKRVIVIDAGHGGKDPGAVGKGAVEKDVTLASARALKAQLEKSGRYRVVLTREKDVFVPLEQRVRIARKAGADLFISLHADAGSEPGIKGASVYTLSENGSHRIAQRVMNKDKMFGDLKLPGSDRAVNQILLDLTQRQTRNQSATFAQLLLGEVDEELTLLRSSHRDAGFVVLLAPDVPAVLLEMGFMTNVEDEKALTDPAKRKRIMAAVAGSIDDYFSQGAKYAAR
jgi:N-acetylmuramoyl-L-alanine amidase